MSRRPGIIRRNLGAARAAVREWIGEDRWVAKVVLIWLVFQLAAAFWDLPGSWGWENDGIAPRDLFGGLANNLIPGKAHRYPLLHNLLLALASLPWLLGSVLWSGATEGFTGDAIMGGILSTPTMTAVSVTAKLMTMAMSGLAVIVLARLARRLFDPSAGRWTALFAVTSLSVSFYGRTSHLDMPYVMWTVLAVDRLVSVVERGDARDYKLFGFFAAAAIATKDQAYASFVLVGPALLLIWPAVSRNALAAGRDHWRRVGAGTLVGAISYGLMSGALLNPTGFVARVKMLTGTNSQDWRIYERSLDGLLAQLHDLGGHQDDFWWPWPLVVLCWIGVAVALVPRAGRRRLMRAVPLLAAVGFLAGFTLVVARDEHRFVLPVGFFLACYGGVACARAAAAFGTPARVVAGAFVGWAALNTLQLHVTQWSDARREVAAYLDTLPPGSVVETYGLTVTQPHFDVGADSPYTCRRVGPKPPKRRNPLPMCDEVEGAWSDALERRPDVIVLTHWARRFENVDTTGVRRTSRAMQRGTGDEAGEFFRAALEDRLPGYRMVLRATSAPPDWLAALGVRTVHVHGSAGVDAWVLRRIEDGR